MMSEVIKCHAVNRNYILNLNIHSFLHRDATGEEKLNVKFEPGELREAARTFEEGKTRDANSNH